MNKKDLKNFMVVKLRNGYKKIFLEVAVAIIVEFDYFGY